VEKSQTGKSGRLRWLSQEASLVACTELLKQPRFAEIAELELRGVYFGPGQPEECKLLSCAARACPKVCKLLLGDARPSQLWSDLGRRMPTALERRLRRLWQSRPFSIEAYGRKYTLS